MFQKSILLFLLLLPGLLIGQQRFKAGVILGANAAQIDGDLSAGFNKLGLSGGLRGVVVLKEKMELSIDMLFSQRGSRSNERNIAAFKVHLNYVEVPVAFNYKDWISEDEDYYKLHFYGGFAYSRLISQSVEDENTGGLGTLEPFFKSNDIGFLVGTTFYSGPKLGFSFRYTRSLFPIFKRSENTPNANSLLGYFLTFQALYLF